MEEIALHQCEKLEILSFIEKHHPVRESDIYAKIPLGHRNLKYHLKKLVKFQAVRKRRIFKDNVYELGYKIVQIKKAAVSIIDKNYPAPSLTKKQRNAANCSS